MDNWCTSGPDGFRSIRTASTNNKYNITMDVIKTAIDGVVIIEPKVFKDARGYFFESFSQRRFEEKIRKINFVQDNESMSSVLLSPRASWFVA